MNFSFDKNIWYWYNIPWQTHEEELNKYDNSLCWRYYYSMDQHQHSHCWKTSKIHLFNSQRQSFQERDIAIGNFKPFLDYCDLDILSILITKISWTDSNNLKWDTYVYFVYQSKSNKLEKTSNPLFWKTSIQVNRNTYHYYCFVKKKWSEILKRRAVNMRCAFTYLFMHAYDQISEYFIPFCKKFIEKSV